MSSLLVMHGRIWPIRRLVCAPVLEPSYLTVTPKANAGLYGHPWVLDKIRVTSCNLFHLFKFEENVSFTRWSFKNRVLLTTLKLVNEFSNGVTGVWRPTTTTLSNCCLTSRYMVPRYMDICLCYFFWTRRYEPSERRYDPRAWQKDP